MATTSPTMNIHKFQKFSEFCKKYPNGENAKDGSSWYFHTSRQLFDVFYVYINETNFLMGTKQNKCFQEFVESNIFVCVSQKHSKKLN